jgi:hypothetical protein
LQSDCIAGAADATSSHHKLVCVVLPILSAQPPHHTVSNRLVH